MEETLGTQYLQLFGFVGAEASKNKVPGECAGKDERTKNLLLHLPFGSLEKDLLTVCSCANREESRLNRNGGVAHLHGERITGSSRSEYGKEGIQSFLGPHHEIMKHASQGGVTEVQGRTIPKVGEQEEAATDFRESAAPVTAEVEQQLSRLKSSPRALITHGNPNEDKVRTKTKTQRLGKMNDISPKGRQSKAARKKSHSQQTPQPPCQNST